MGEDARKIFRRNLNDLLYQRRVSQKELAAALGYTASTVSDWCTGKNYPRIDRMQQIADFFHVPMEALTTAHDQTLADEYRLLLAWRGAEESARQIALEVLENHQSKKEDTRRA